MQSDCKEFCRAKIQAFHQSIILSVRHGGGSRTVWGCFFPFQSTQAIPALKASKLPEKKNLEQPNQSLDLSQTEMF